MALTLENIQGYLPKRFILKETIDFGNNAMVCVGVDFETSKPIVVKSIAREDEDMFIQEYEVLMEVGKEKGFAEILMSKQCPFGFLIILEYMGINLFELLLD